MQFIYSDGGRKEAGFKGSAGDCVARAVAIASGKPYAEVYKALSAIQRSRADKVGKSLARSRSARDGVNIRLPAFREYMASLGFTWTPTMRVGQGCKVHLRANELPMGRLVVQVSRHTVAVIDRVVFDTYDEQRGGRRCVYGYWRAA